jgi:AcrR family transcriptional regulator
VLDEKKTKAACLRFADVDVTKIADEVGISRATFYNWEKTEEFKAEVDRIRQEYLSTIDNLAITEGLKSLKKLAHLRDNARSEKVQSDAASKILDKVKSNATHITVDDERLSEFISADVLEQELSDVVDE